jgi:hypothetical protein
MFLATERSELFSRERMAVDLAGVDVGSTSTPAQLSTSIGGAVDTTSTTSDAAFPSATDSP